MSTALQVHFANPNPNPPKLSFPNTSDHQISPINILPFAVQPPHASSFPSQYDLAPHLTPHLSHLCMHTYTSRPIEFAFDDGKGDALGG
ncbi:uncharacterized protein BJ212DRAFT_1484434 [Suillus subaureus]|uniref:Uncharacterized protein n=1 Tax=Suillus subaureus TaxID=48587 RepID=A0A9P7E2F6_9AGAM|nr:uncharacterized protein BJ212DRAFT_1484434 [Suillus subaureus]KAG1809311.1 hypothetical protein BJ212DRAFT_1484434 [Suillus subaureus]